LVGTKVVCTRIMPAVPLTWGSVDVSRTLCQRSDSARGHISRGSALSSAIKGYTGLVSQECRVDILTA
jgi:hypothetical protein